MGHDQRPGTQRHEFPGEQKSESVVGQQHQIHAGQKRREERQQPPGRVLVLAVAQGEQAGDGAAQIDHDQEKGGQRVQPEMRAQPGQTQRQGEGRRCGRGQQMRQRQRQQDDAKRQRDAVDPTAATGSARRGDRVDARREQDHQQTQQ